MKKRLIIRGLMGFPLGMALGEGISITISLFWGQGEYMPCAPQFVEVMGNETYAVALQALLCGIMGAAFAMASVIWEIEKWSIAKQTGIYFSVTAAVMMPIAYITGWMEHSLRGAAVYFGIFVVIFVVMWVAQYSVIKQNIRKMNENLNKKGEM